MYVVFDIETTGFDSVTCDVIQFAYAMFDNNNMFVKSENLYFYYEGMSWSQEAADQSHHLSLAFLKQYEDDFRKNILKMFSVLNRANVCGHNLIHFDCPFVKRWLQRMGLPGLEYGVVQDTMLAYRPITKRSRIKLTKLADMCGLTDESIKYATSIWFNTGNDTYAHNAAYDVSMTALLTIQGVNKNLIKFDFSSKELSEHDIDDLDISLEGDSSPAKQSDPNGYVVMLTEDDGYVRYYWVNHDKNKYGDVSVSEDDIQSYKQLNRFLPVKLYKANDTLWSGSSKDINFSLHIDASGDSLHITTQYVTLVDKNVDITKIIETNFKEEV